MRYFLILLCWIVASTAIFAQKESDKDASRLRRRAQLGFRLQMLPNLPQAEVVMVSPDASANKSGLLVGDRVMMINEQPITDVYALQSILQRVRGGDRVTLTFLRGDYPNPRIVSFVVPALPLEEHAGLTLEATQVTNDYGDRLRMFVTKPSGSTDRLPAILFVSWLSCSTVEDRGKDDSWSRMLHDVASGTGALMVRLEKPGAGDSEGPPCSSCDLAREINGYQAALRYMKSRTDVDTSRIVIFGGSLGGTLTAAVGKGHSIKAYVTAVSVYKTWLEHMIELERRRLALTDTGPSSIAALMPGYIEFNHTYLTGKKTPEQVIVEKPHLKDYWYDDPAHQYGRPAVFYHQVQAMNFMQNWQQVDSPVLVVAGAYDWIMTLEDSHLLIDEINKRHPGSATLLVGEQMDHHWKKYNSPRAAFDEKGGTYDSATVSGMVRWIKDIIKK